MITNTILDVFARNLQEYRKAKGLSQEQLAAKAGAHRTYVGMMERSEKNVTLLSMEKMARALDIDITDLLKR